jgi:hypothetical protein
LRLNGCAVADCLLNIPEDNGDLPWFIEPKDKDPANEFQRQTLFLSRIHSLAPSIDVLAVPNAGKSTDWERIQRWREGARRGALDLVITWNRGVMFAEFKDGQKMPTKEQRERLNRYMRMGHHCGVYRTADTLISHLRDIGAPFLSSIFE